MIAGFDNAKNLDFLSQAHAPILVKFPNASQRIPLAKIHEQLHSFPTGGFLT